jgi:flagellar motor switch protein FliG
MSTPANTDSIFLNGKNQIVEMLRFMSADDRKKLLQGIRLRNASMAQELESSSLTFDDFLTLNDTNLSKVIQFMDPSIMGVALRSCSPEFQRRVLSLTSHEHAERAFALMVKPMARENTLIKRAQEKVIELLVSLSRKSQIIL